MSELPILYSFRRCPYAIRARMAVAAAGVQVALREVVLRNKPDAMLAASAKGTVPVLVLLNGSVIDESLDVMHWALAQHDPEAWLSYNSGADALIAENDGPFKGWLDKYKYADRHPEHPQTWYRIRGEAFLGMLEQRLMENAWLGGPQPGLADIAVFPFIRQFAGVEPDWFATAPYPKLRGWLDTWLSSEAFTRVMAKHAPWEPNSEVVTFPEGDG